MKKWIYLIFPGAMLVAFLVFHAGYKKQAEAHERVLLAKMADEKAELDRKKKDAEAKAREDAAKRQRERDDEEHKKEQDKAARQAKDDQMVRDQIAEFTRKAGAARELVSKLETELAGLRQEKEKATRENFDLAKQVEVSRIARRDAEMEIQRATEMLTRRAADSSLVRSPPMAPAGQPGG
jgi:FtsZ-interacting cell division protein ZipA